MTRFLKTKVIYLILTVPSIMGGISKRLVSTYNYKYFILSFFFGNQLWLCILLSALDINIFIFTKGDMESEVQRGYINLTFSFERGRTAYIVIFSLAIQFVNIH